MKTRLIAIASLATLVGPAPPVRAQTDTAEARPPVRFQDVSSLAGVVSTPDWKYGGPCVADFNGDGYYDFMLGNHDQTPIQFFIANGDGTYAEQPGPLLTCPHGSYQSLG